MKKRIKAPKHQDLVKPYFRDKELQKKIKSGVKRLAIISQIVQLREALGLTQKQLATRIGVSQPFIAKLENDQTTNLSLETLVKIATALDANVEIKICPDQKAA